MPKINRNGLATYADQIPVPVPAEDDKPAELAKDKPAEPEPAERGNSSSGEMTITGVAEVVRGNRGGKSEKTKGK